ncbi:phage tail protein [Thermoanaerobacterium thermosaccharolyticum]|jgi:hypothetical protein|uniref:phage tail protein n=1 Tax=Thermoanaerobacterium thermosaccharolyticum TaxID=1517 RepID=UPI003D2A1BE3
MARDIFVDTKQLNRIAIELKNLDNQIPGAASSAVNRTLDFVYTRIGRLVTQEYAIKVSDVKKTMTKYKASKTNLYAKIISKGHTLSLAHFPFSPKKPMTGGKRRKAKAVKVKIKRQEGYKTIKTNPLPFVASTGARSADKTQFNVFKREGSSRLPIKVLRTLSIPQMITNVNVSDQIQKLAQEKLMERIQHEIEWRLDKAAQKVKE